MSKDLIKISDSKEVDSPEKSYCLHFNVRGERILVDISPCVLDNKKVSKVVVDKREDNPYYLPISTHEVTVVMQEFVLGGYGSFDEFLKLKYGSNEMATNKWIQKAAKKMKAKGTVGSFTKIAKKAGGVSKSGKIKSSFIEKELHSKNPAVRKKANFAKNVRKS